MMKKSYNPLNLIIVLAMVVSALCVMSCNRQESDEDSVKHRDLAEIREDDTLRVVTMYGPTSYFLYKDNEAGYEYEMAKSLSEAIGVKLKITVAESEVAMYKMMTLGDADLIAYKMPYISKYKDGLAYTNLQSETYQVILQCKSDSMARDVLDLVGREVVVRQGSRFEHRLKHLNDEVGGGINIVYAADTVTSEDLIGMVATHKIPMTVTTYDIARISQNLFPKLDYSLGISFPQRAAWAVGKDSYELLAFINKWAEDKKHIKEFTKLYRRYFEQSIAEANKIELMSRNGISQYDHLFKIYGQQIGWDWKLLAAMAYKESKFDPMTVSWAGACGLMQLMPKTAISLGADSVQQMFDPEVSVSLCAKYLKKLEKLFPSVTDPDEKVKFTLAAYNSGPAHIFDARALARKYGKDPDVWFGNVEHYILLKSEPEFYTDSVCKYGYCRGIEVVTYVKQVISKWEQYKTWSVK